MFGFLKSESFNLFFSFIIGLGIASLFVPRCKTGDCTLFKAAAVKDVEATTYQIGEKCYHFTTNTVPCPASTDVIEPFRHM